MITESQRIASILSNDLYKSNLKSIEEAESDRIFCKHDMEHFDDVIKIASHMAKQNHSKVNSEWIYAAGLLHDIGRGREYTDGTPHDEASVEIARVILKEAGFRSYERLIILNAIRHHRNKTPRFLLNRERSLRSILNKADKLSRKCYECKAADLCYWPMEKRNREDYFEDR
ncbi:MAG: HD domain-containing protein [Acetatifactor sp.]|nr:HD domain-containing protein [Acetatifactor sp.]